MNRRLYFMLPNVEAARVMMDDLLLSRVNADRIHFLAKSSTPMGDLPEASISERTNLIEGWEIGMGMGALLGLIAGLLTLWIPTWWFTEPVPIIVVFICTAVGLVAGGFWTALVATNIPNTQLKRFEGQIAQGKVLMIVRTPFHRIKEVRELVVKRHPEATYKGVWPADHVMFP
ncbi:MAG: hypothetical protein Q8K83_01205 [Methylotenera sp.]|nr:hypothetical protein [Methylotenera sp.]MDZ4141078.1 hypothetical protein [Methylotenera sp.]